MTQVAAAPGPLLTTGPTARIFGIPEQRFFLILYFVVLAKLCGIRIWSHMYAGEPQQITRLTYYTEFLITVICLSAAMARFQVFLAACRQMWAVIPFLVYSQVAAFFVPGPKLAAFQTTSGYIEAFIACAMVVHFVDLKVLHRLMVKAALIGVVINLAALARPSISIMLYPLAGYFRGFVQHRNELSQFAVIAIYFAVSARSLAPDWQRWGTILVALALIGLSRSVQGFLLLPAGLGAYVLIRNSRLLRHPMFWVCGSFAIGAGLFVYFGFGGINGLLAYLGRDATLSGRDRIWDLTFYLIRTMPLGGFGFANFGSDVLSPALLASFNLGTHFGTAHNSYLEALIAYGWPGGLLFFCSVIFGLVILARALWRRSSPQVGLAAMLMLMCVVGGFTESSKLFTPGLGWFTFLLAILFARGGAPDQPAPPLNLGSVR